MGFEISEALSIRHRYLMRFPVTVEPRQNASSKFIDHEAENLANLLHSPTANQQVFGRAIFAGAKPILVATCSGPNALHPQLMDSY